MADHAEPARRPATTDAGRASFGHAALQRPALGEIAEQLNAAPRVVAQRALAARLSASGQPALPPPRPNRTGLPSQLKAGIEALSGVAMDDVRVHRNSSAPAQLQAHAYAQGSDIHLAPGQEKHLPHEAWHVVQQKQGRVKPNLTLETPAAAASDAPVQRAVGFEFQARNWQFFRGEDERDPGRGTAVSSGAGWHLESDGGEPEFVVDHRDENKVDAFKVSMGQITTLAAKFRDGYVVKATAYDKTPRALTIKPTTVEAKVTADPQITAGIRFERLSSMMSLLAQREGPTSLNQANKHLMQNRQAANYSGDDRLLGSVVQPVRAGLAERFPDAAPGLTAYTFEEREHVVGLLALLASYLKKMPKAPLWKDVPLLSKSNLGKAVAASPLWTLAGKWLHDLSRPNAAGELKEVVIAASGRAAGDYVLPKPADGRPFGPKVGDWLDGLFVNRIDKLSYLHDTDLDASMGPLDKVDQVKDHAAAPIIEMRRVNHAMPYTEWAAFVEQVREWTARINDLDADDLDYKPPAKEEGKK